MAVEAFMSFLDSVDGPGKRSHGDFLTRVQKAFEACEAVEETDLIGKCAVLLRWHGACSYAAPGMNASIIPKDLYKTAAGAPSPAMQSFMDRAIKKVCLSLRPRRLA